MQSVTNNVLFFIMTQTGCGASTRFAQIDGAMFFCKFGALATRAKNSTGRAGSIRLDQRKPAGQPRAAETFDTESEAGPEFHVQDAPAAVKAEAATSKGSKRRRCAHSQALIIGAVS